MRRPFATRAPGHVSGARIGVGDRLALASREQGELVFTSLTREAMPVVRYRTRDLTRLLPGTALAPHRRMEKVTGRSDDMMIVRGVNVFPSQIEEQILRTPGLTRTTSACSSVRDGWTRSPYGRGRLRHLGRRGRGPRRRARRAREGGGRRDIEVDVVSPGAIERSQGKAKRIDDRRA